MEQIKWIWNYMKGRRLIFVIGLVLSVITAAMRVINALLAKELIDDVLIPQNTEPLIRLLVIMMIVQLARLGLHYLMIIFMEIANTDVMTRIRRDMFNGRISAFWGFFQPAI